MKQTETMEELEIIAGNILRVCDIVVPPLIVVLILVLAIRLYLGYN